jgi:DNA-binding response OmpR family regulator
VAVLILDNDPGLIFWLGNVLGSEGITALPASSITEAETLLRQLKGRVELLIANPALPGAREFAESLLQSQWRLPILAVVERDGSGAGFRGADATLFRPSSLDGSQDAEWRQTIRRILGGHIAERE